MPPPNPGFRRRVHVIFVGPVGPTLRNSRRPARIPDAGRQAESRSRVLSGPTTSDSARGWENFRRPLQAWLIRQPGRQPEPKPARRMAEAADSVHLAQYAARCALRAIATQIQCTVALRAARVA